MISPDESVDFLATWGGGEGGGVLPPTLVLKLDSGIPASTPVHVCYNMK